MSNLARTLERFSTRRSFCTLVVLETMLLGAVNLLDFPLSVPFMLRLTGHNYLDMCAFCSAPKIYSELIGFGEPGRHLQMSLMATIDIAIPVTSLAFGVIGLNVLRHPKSAKTILLVPFTAFALDVLENLGIIGVTLQYPAHSVILSTLVGAVSGLKFCAYFLTLLIILTLASRRFLSRVVLRRTTFVS